MTKLPDELAKLRDEPGDIFKGQEFTRGFDVGAEAMSNHMQAEVDKLTRGLNHPCKETCSGWRQGYETGKLEIKEYTTEMDKLVEALKWYVENEGESETFQLLPDAPGSRALYAYRAWKDKKA